LEVLYINFLAVGGFILGYFAVATMAGHLDGSQVKWTSTGLDAREIRLLSNFPADYEHFIEHAKQSTKLGSMVVNRPVIEDATDNDSSQ
jgi:hypothetical protein